MTVLTLTPDERAFAIALVTLASSAAATLAGLIHARRRAAPAAFLPTYAATIAGIAALAAALLGVPSVGRHSPSALALAAAVGAAACLVAWRGEALVTRAAIRRGSGSAPPGRVPARAELVRPDLAGAAGGSDGRVLVWLLVVGAGEEVLFRGVLVELIGLAPVGALPRAALLASSVVVFALSHTWLGLGQALAKLPLGVACLGAALSTGTLLAPVLAHAAYNAVAWHAARPRDRARPRAGHDPRVAGAGGGGTR